jgi:hypothetical protein
MIESLREKLIGSVDVITSHSVADYVAILTQKRKKLGILYILRRSDGFPMFRRFARMARKSEAIKSCNKESNIIRRRWLWRAAI